MEIYTHRQHLEMIRWLREEWNNPSRTDYYLMGVMREIRRVLMSKGANDVQAHQFKMAFLFPGHTSSTPPSSDSTDSSSTHDTAASPGKKTPRPLSRWLGMMTAPVTYQTITREEFDYGNRERP